MMIWIPKLSDGFLVCTVDHVQELNVSHEFDERLCRLVYKSFQIYIYYSIDKIRYVFR